MNSKRLIKIATWAVIGAVIGAGLHVLLFGEGIRHAILQGGIGAAIGGAFGGFLATSPKRQKKSLP